MKVEKKTGSFYVLGYLLELSIKIWRSGIFLFLKSGELGPFFPWKILYRLKSYFTGQNLTKFPPSPPHKKNTTHAQQQWQALVFS